MKKIFLSSCVLLSALCGHAQMTLYTKETIPADLLPKSKSVKRFSKDEFVVSDPSHAIYKHRDIVTVLNKEAEGELHFINYTDSFDKLDEVQITLYNKLGLVSKVFKKKDLSQHAINYGQMDDATYYELSIAIAKEDYPVTMETSYTQKFSGLLVYPSFDFISPEQAVEQASYTAVVPKSMGLRFKNQNTDIKPVITEDANNITYSWEVKKINAIPNEPSSVVWRSRFPKVWIAPNKFKMDDYEGDMTTWNNFGKWNMQLAQKTNDLSVATKAELNTLVANAKDDKEKISILYNRLQENCRYVSIQLGIGGFKPFNASFTDQKKYGDCKGLSNYMRACLEAVGIKSYLATVNSGYNAAPVDPAFPVHAFNHMILCVPMKTDTVWLECTNKYNECGVLGNFTENRNALLVTENGGVLVQTPLSKAADNRLTITNNIEVQENGAGKLHSVLACTGEFRFGYIELLKDATSDDQKSYLLKSFKVSTPDEFNFTMPEDIKSSTLNCTMDAGFEKIAAFKTGNKIFLNRSIQAIIDYSMPENKNRTQDYYFEFPFQKSDTTIYHLPAGYTVEHLPETNNLTCKHGSYTATSTYDAANNTVASITHMQLNQYKIPAADYEEVRLFIGRIVGDETQKIIIVKK